MHRDGRQLGRAATPLPGILEDRLAISYFLEVRPQNVNWMASRTIRRHQVKA
jgi:hypothetical protein